MMGPGDSYHQSHHHHNLTNSTASSLSSSHSLPMDLHVPQGFPYYRYRNEPFCWTERKPEIDDMTGQGAMHARQVFEQAGRFPPTGHSAPPILELRKEKSRDAARSRRGKENYEFYELAKMLPLPAAITSQLDKASIIRLTISYLRLKDFSAHGDPPWVRDNPTSNKKGSRPRSSGNIHLDLFEQHQGTHILQSLDGFAFSLAADGRFLYISETVSIYLGLSQVELTGSSVFDYIHQGDHAELAEQLGLGLSHGPGANVPSPAGSEDGSSNSATNNPDVSSLMSISSNAGYKGPDRAFCIRMKSTLTKRGCHFKSSGYRVVLVLCRLRAQYSFSQSRKAPPPLLGMVAMAIALPPPSVHEIRLETDMFVTRLSFDFRIIHCEPRVSDLLDYSADEMMGKNLYTLCHAEDVKILRKTHIDLLEKGQVMSQYHRILNKNGGFTWVQICATIVCSSKNSDEQSIICVNYILSGKEYANTVMDCCQLDQECLPSTVKKEIFVDEHDKKSPDQDSSDESGRVRDASAGQPIELARPARSAPGLPRAPEIREKRTNLHSRSSTGSGRHEDPISMSESQPLTPISSTTPDHADARTPQSIRSLDSEPFVATSVKPTKGRKRKKGAVNGDVPPPMESPTGRGVSPSHRSTNFSKRQIIVQNDTPDGGRGIEGAGISMSGNAVAIDNASPHNSIDADNSGDSSRWRKSNHQQWSGSGASSVKDLEQVMSKHLPGRDSEHVSSIISAGIDFSTDSLLRQQSGSRSGSAIQWVGPGSQSTPGLPVSALLRQLCASRESVIRANVQAAAAAAVVAARGGNSYYPDMSTVQSALPTPPGSDNYIADSQFMLSSHSHQKSANDFSAIVPYSSYDYQPAMTPPASVSPREKSASYSATNGETSNGYGESATPATTSTSFRPPQSYLDSPAQPLPLKPQVYGYHPHSSIESQYGTPLADHSQSQFYPPPHTSFHLYHPGKPSPYGDPLKSTNWYSTTS